MTRLKIQKIESFKNIFCITVGFGALTEYWQRSRRFTATELRFTMKISAFYSDRNYGFEFKNLFFKNPSHATNRMYIKLNLPL